MNTSNRTFDVFERPGIGGQFRASETATRISDTTSEILEPTKTLKLEHNKK